MHEFLLVTYARSSQKVPGIVV